MNLNPTAIPSRFRLPSLLLMVHLSALVFGLIGLLIMLPHPDLWMGDPRGVRVFTWSMTHAGATHILLGALAMFAFGVAAIGFGKTAVFFVVSTSLSLSSELIGTGTGWPFGNYAYTDFLGYKVLGRVPYTIPLSWFYLGFACYLLAAAIVQSSQLRSKSFWTVALGAWFLTVWDLVLDPAMAHESLRVKFWVWDQSGPYFGMPIKNFIGWTITGILYMAISRLIWRKDVDASRYPKLFPFTVYAANVGFAMVLSASVSLYLPILLAGLFGIGPALLTLRADRGSNRSRPAPAWRPSPSP